MDSGKNSREHRAIQGKFDVIVEHLAANTDPAQFAQKLYQVEMVSQHVVEGARVVVFTPSQRIQPVMVAVQSCIELQPSKYADFIQVVRDVYPALADVLNEYYMSSLEINVVDAVADVSEWEELACQINLDLGKLHELQQSGKSPDRCKKELLRHWVEKDKRASWTKLSQALERMKKAEIAQTIKEEYCQPCSQDIQEEETSEDKMSGDEAKEDENDTISMEIEEFEDRFEELAYLAQVAIEDHTPMKRFRCTLRCLPLSIKQDHLKFLENSLPNIDKAEDFDEIFRYLNLYWNFIDYHLLEYVIKKYGDESLKAKIGEYVRDLAAFRKNTTIAQVCRFAKSWSIRPDLPQHFSTLRTKFSKSAAEYTLEELEQFRLTFCREFSLSLSESVAMLAAGVMDGSVVLLWHIPSSLVDDLMPAVFSHPRSFFEQQLVVEIVLNGICVYDSQETLPGPPRCEGEVTDAEVVGTKPSSLSLEIPPLDEDEESTQEGDSAEVEQSDTSQEQLIEQFLIACGEGSIEAVATILQQGTISKEWLQTAVEMACESEHSDIVNLLMNEQEKSIQEGEVEQSDPLQEQLSAQEGEVGQSGTSQEQLIEQFLLACGEGNIGAVAAVLQKGTIPQEWLQTAVEMACESEHSSIVNLLLNEQEKHGDTALIRATINGHHPTVQELLKTGADPNFQNQDGATALHWASEKGESLIVKELLESGADPNIQTEQGSTALIRATVNGHHPIVQELLKTGADPNIQNQNGDTALTLASYGGHHDVAVELIAARADVNVQTGNGNTALILASNGGHHDVAVELIAARADVNVQTKHGNTALICASAEGHHDVAVELITARADVDVQNQHGETALICASAEGHHDVAVELIAARADANVQNQSGATALTLASEHGYYRIARDLLKSGADPNIQNENGSTALTLASTRGHHDVVMELIAARADVNVQTKKGHTALMLAIARGHLEIATDLLQAGADVNIQNEDGYSALMVSAYYSGSPDIVEWLITKGAQVNIPNKDGLTPLQAAIQKHHTEVVRKLLDAGADIDITEKTTGWTAMFFAAKEGEAEIVQLLLQRGADLRTVDKENVTALEIAQAQGHEEVCRVLQDYLQSQQSLPAKEVSAGDTDKPPESQRSLQTEDVSTGDTDKPIESQQSLQTEEVGAGDTDKPPESQQSLQTKDVSTGDTDKPIESVRQQVLKERVIRANNYFKTLFKRLEQNLLPSKVEKAEFQSYPSPHRQTSKRAKKGKRQSDKRSKTVDVNIPAVP